MQQIPKVAFGPVLRSTGDVRFTGRVRNAGAAPKVTTNAGNDRTRSIVVFGILCLLLLLAPSVAFAQTAQPDVSDDDPFRLTVLHFGNSGSALLETPDQPGVAAFVAKARAERRGADRFGGVVLLGTGDYLAEGPTLAASLGHPERFFDAEALSRLPVDAYAVGPGDLAFGPDVLGEFANGFNRRPVLGPFIAANLDAGTDPALLSLVEGERLLPSTVVETDGRKVGVVSVADPIVAPSVSMGGGVFDPEVAQAAQVQIDLHTAAGVDIVVLVSDLATTEANRQLAAELRGVDVVLSATEPDPSSTIDLLLDADGQIVVWAAAAGGYSELGRLVLLIDDAGTVVGVEAANPRPIDPAGRVDLWTQRSMDQLRTEIARFATDQIARTQVDLDGIRSDLRSGETNLGNLVADALLWRGAAHAERIGTTAPEIALLASELISSDALFRAPELTMRDTFDIAGEAGNVVLVEAVARDELKNVLEDAVATMEDVTGRFPQFAGFTLDIDLLAQARIATVFGVEEPGARIVNLTLLDGTPIIADGQVVPGDPLSIVTTDRLVLGVDRYQLTSITPVSAGGPLRQAIVNYVSEELSGAISLGRYPEGGDERLYKG